MTRIGYQGVKFSHNYFAALRFAERMELSMFELIPLVASQGVINALKKNEICFGVMAFHNKYAGIVSETSIACKNELLEEIDAIVLPIRHCLFSNQNDAQINKIISHEMAIKQCLGNIKSRFSKIEVKSVETTAKAAEYVYNNTFGKNVAAICSKEAGEFFDLKLLIDDFQDYTDNLTEFRILKLKE